jgi:hypothetical protein
VLAQAGILGGGERGSGHPEHGRITLQPFRRAEEGLPAVSACAASLSWRTVIGRSTTLNPRVAAGPSSYRPTGEPPGSSTRAARPAGGSQSSPSSSRESASTRSYSLPARAASFVAGQHADHAMPSQAKECHRRAVTAVRIHDENGTPSLPRGRPSRPAG